MPGTPGKGRFTCLRAYGYPNSISVPDVNTVSLPCTLESSSHDMLLCFMSAPCGTATFAPL